MRMPGFYTTAAGAVRGNHTAKLTPPPGRSSQTTRPPWRNYDGTPAAHQPSFCAQGDDPALGIHVLQIGYHAMEQHVDAGIDGGLVAQRAVDVGVYAYL